MIKYTQILLIMHLASAQNEVSLHAVSLNEIDQPQQVIGNLDNQSQSALLKVTIEDQKILENAYFQVIINSSDPDLSVDIFSPQESSKDQKQRNVATLITYQGNIIFLMSNQFYGGDFNFLRETGQIEFQIFTTKSSVKTFKATVVMSNKLKLQLGDLYTVKIDPQIKRLEVEWEFGGDKKIEKLRFQSTVVRHQDDYQMSSTLSDEQNDYRLNNIFKNILGGCLTKDFVEICTQDKCTYSQQLTLKGVSVFNLESYKITGTEELSIYHYNEYYDRVYKDNAVVYYKLNYMQEMEGMDVSVNFIPVVGDSALYVNVNTLPLTFDKYDFKEKGHLAKRITIRWDELKRMKAEGSDIYIAIKMFKKGEFLVKIDAHESDYRGRLSRGVHEQGLVKYDQNNVYLYSIEVYKTQKIKFITKLSIISGEANLYVKKCKKLRNCKFLENDLTDDKIANVKNRQNIKEIASVFECKTKSSERQTTCNYLIAVHGKEDHGTHYEISVQENRYHLLLVPGHLVNISLLPQEQKFLKFSYPGNSKNSKLFLSVEPVWGTFNLFIDKNEQYPNEQNANFTQKFYSDQAGLYNSHQVIDVESQVTNSLNGPFYLTLKGISSSSINIKFFEKSNQEQALHTLLAGHSQKGILDNEEEIMYFTINLSLENEIAETVSVDLTPLKGHFVMFANREGKLPTLENNDLISYNNSLELQYKNYKDHKQYIIGVQGVKQTTSQSFRIGVSYNDKPVNLSPGILGKYQSKTFNYFLIEILTEMKDLLILKGLNDGYNITICAKFGVSQMKKKEKCYKKSTKKNISMYFFHDELIENCQQKFDKEQKCFLQISVVGFTHQSFTMGYTYNDKPFMLVKENIVFGPSILKQEFKINFIYHAQPDKSIGFYFNSKGRQNQILTKLVSSEDFKDDQSIKFPNLADFDRDNQTRKGSITTIVYPRSQLSSIKNHPEILLTVIPSKRIKVNSLDSFDNQNGFILQSFMGTKEILRTQVHSEHLQMNEWYYYYFYSNGKQKHLRIYANTNNASLMEVMVARNKNSRPPINQKPLISKTGVSSVVLDLNKEILKEGSGKNYFRGHFTVAVRTEQPSLLHIYWNNVKDFDYVELTPHIPSSMSLKKSQKLYFQFYVPNVNISKNKRKKIREGMVVLHLQSNVPCKVYILKQDQLGELRTPSSKNHDFKTSVGSSGGISLVEIRKKDERYCVECEFVGVVESKSYEGKINLVYTIEHHKEAVMLTQGLTFPDKLRSHRGKTYRFLNTDEDYIYLNVSMLIGTVNIFIDSKEDVSVNKFKESFFLQQQLESHKFIKINPKNYGIGANEDIFIRLENPKLDDCSFTINVYKNFVDSPLERGITKFLHLDSKDKTRLFFEQKSSEKEFELRLTLRKTPKREDIDEAIKNIKKMVKITQEYQLENTEIQELLITVSENKLFAEFSIYQTEKGTFYINIENPNNFPLTFSVDLIVGKYKLIHQNDTIIDSLTDEKSKIYESHGILGMFWFLEMRMCFGKTDVSIFQNDIGKAEKKKFNRHKTVEDNSTYVHYVRLKHANAFAMVANKNTDKSFYTVTAYSEKDLNDNPYQELNQENEGQVQILTDKNQVKFKAIEIKDVHEETFYHKVTYTAYLTSSFKQMRFLKNCGDYYINKAFDDPDFISQKKIFYYKGTKALNKEKSITIQLPKLDQNKKYYGIVVVDIELHSTDEGWMEPLISSKAYYDEFIYVSSKLSLSIDLIGGIIILLGFFGSLAYLIRNYVYSDVHEGIHEFKSIKDITNNFMGVNTEEILESEFDVDFLSDKKSATTQEQSETEMNDAPLD